MGICGKPAEFRVNGKVNLAKSTSKKDKAGVCTKSGLFRVNGKVNLAKSTDKITANIGAEPVNVEKAYSNKKQRRKSRHTFRKLFVAIIDILDTINMSLVDMPPEYLAFMIPGFVVLILIGLCLLSMWFEGLFGEYGKAWAVITVFIYLAVNAIMAFIIHAINSVLHNESDK